MFDQKVLTLNSLRFDIQNPNAIGFDKVDGLLRFGPFRRLKGSPSIAILFPYDAKEEARLLYRLFKDGNSKYKGFSTTFRGQFSGANVDVVPVQASRKDSLQKQSEAFTKAAKNHVRDANADLYIGLHERTPDYISVSPYYALKGSLLECNKPSQSVTFDLLRSDPSLEWSIGNIALGAFCKLGGVPWVVNRVGQEEHLVIGVGVAERRDDVSRARTRRMAYTTCTTAGGEFHFSSIASVAATKEEHLAQLGETVRLSLSRAAKLASVKELTVHMTKDFGDDERQAIRSAVINAEIVDQVETYFVKVTEEDRFFVVDTDDSSYVPLKGQCIKLDDHDHVLYTDGRSDRKSFRGRFPTAIRVTQYPSLPGELELFESLQRVLDQSQVNFRGFNALSKPASLIYSEQVAKLVGFGFDELVAGRPDLLDSMWFL